MEAWQAYRDSPADLVEPPIEELRDDIEKALAEPPEDGFTIEQLRAEYHLRQ